jgi:predicted AAA+ superfamily ATPase
MSREATAAVIAEWLEDFAVPPLVTRRPGRVDLSTLSEIMYQLVGELLASSRATKEDILFVDFEDYRLTGLTTSGIDDLLESFNRLTGRGPSFLFFDEIQHLPGWSRVLRTLHNQRRYRIVVSGSNSSLLAEEVASELRGRYRDLVMLPFSFSEVLALKGVEYSERTLHTPARGRLIGAFDEYLATGGFPEVVGKVIRAERRDTLQSYVRTIFYRDIVERHNVRATHILDAMMRHCLGAYADLFSVSAFEKGLKSAGLPGSKRTIATYLKYLEEAFFLLVHQKYSFSPRKRVMNPKKVYLLDPGFAMLSPGFSENRGKRLENVVAVELRRRGEECFYHHGRRECDFIITQDGRPRQAVQVCQELTDRNRRREIEGLADAAEALGTREALVLTFDQRETLVQDGLTATVRPVWEWLLGPAAGAPLAIPEI